MADARWVTAAPSGPVASRVRPSGRSSAGAVVSPTCTGKEPPAALPAPSEVEHSTIVIPSGNVAPGAGAQLTGLAPSTASAADARYATSAPSAPVASATTSPGRSSTGAVVSGAGAMSVTVRSPSAPGSKSSPSPLPAPSVSQ